MKGLSSEVLEKYLLHLKREERSPSTQKQYRRDLAQFFAFAGSEKLTKELIVRYKQALRDEFQPSSVNVKLAAVNDFLRFLGHNDFRVRQLKIQRKVYCPKERSLSRQEYLRLIRAADARHDERLSLLLQTLCSTGIRVSELQFITAEAVRRGEAYVSLKGKSRVIFLPEKLRKALNEYLRRNKIRTGPVFVTRTGRPLDRSNIWKMMKALCHLANVKEEKVFPHNLRHLFAQTFYSADKDIAKLADLLGHSNINTTRIYIAACGTEHQRLLNGLGLVVAKQEKTRTALTDRPRR